MAFGALAVPITTLATVTELPLDDLGSMVGRQTPVLAVFVPLVLVFIIDGRRGIAQVWPPALVCGVDFGVFQYLASNFWSIPLADIVAALASALAVLAFIRVWHPEGGLRRRRRGARDGGPAPRVARATPMAVAAEPDARAQRGSGSGRTRGPRPPRRHRPRLRAHLIIVVVFVIATRVPAIAGTAPPKPGQTGTGLEAATRIVNWPGLHIRNSSRHPGDDVQAELPLGRRHPAAAVRPADDVALQVGPGARRAPTGAPSPSSSWRSSPSWRCWPWAS